MFGVCEFQRIFSFTLLIFLKFDGFEKLNLKKATKLEIKLFIKKIIWKWIKEKIKIAGHQKAA